MSVPELRKRIHFYDVEFIGRDDDDDEIRIAPGRVMRHIAELPIAAAAWGSSSRYMPMPDAGDDTLLIEILARSSTSVRGAFAVKRRSGIPRIEGGGAYRDIALSAEEGLAEIRHFVLWPRRQLLGIEVNGRGPTISRLRAYLEDKAADVGVEEVRLRMRLAADQFDLVQRARKISSATVEVTRDRLDEVGDLDPGLEAGLRQIAGSSNARTVQVELRLRDRHADASLELPWLTRARRFLTDPDHREALEKLRVQAYDDAIGRMREVDSSRIASSVMSKLSRSKAAWSNPSRCSRRSSAAATAARARVKRWWSRTWRAALRSWWSLTVVLAAAIALLEGVRDAVPAQVSGAQTTIYATVGGVAGGLLGFLVASITFLAGLPADRPLLQRLRASARGKPSVLERTLTLFGRAAVSLSLLTLVALLGLAIDRQPQAPVRSEDLGAGAYWMWLVVFAALPATVRVARCVRVLNVVAHLAVSPAREADASDDPS